MEQKYIELLDGELGIALVNCNILVFKNGKRWLEREQKWNKDKYVKALVIKLFGVN